MIWKHNPIIVELMERENVRYVFLNIKILWFFSFIYMTGSEEQENEGHYVYNLYILLITDDIYCISDVFASVCMCL